MYENPQGYNIPSNSQDDKKFVLIQNTMSLETLKNQLDVKVPNM